MINLKQTKMTYLHVSDDKSDVIKRTKFQNKICCKAVSTARPRYKMAKQVDESI